jgi:hypothetical protein
MRLVRTILAFMIAMSLALLPVGAAASHVMDMTGMAMNGMGMADAAAMQMDSSSAMNSAEMNSAGMSMDDCCPDDIKGHLSHAAADKCNMGFCCAGAAALDDVRAVTLALRLAKAVKLGIPADQVVAFESDGPPFRPPRI